MEHCISCQIDDGIFRKMKAVYGLRSIPPDDPSYPKAVVMAGARAARYLYQLQGRLEKSFECQGPATDVKVTDFFADSGNDQNAFAFIIKSEPLFKPVAVPRLHKRVIVSLDCAPFKILPAPATLIFV